MATDTLEIFGTEYSGVTGVKATDSNNQTKTYIRPQGTVNITSSGNTDVTAYATASVSAGSATASATKGTVSNHSVSVTPSVTRTAGYITAGSANGTAVTVTASELASGNKAITQNGTNIDVVGYSTVSVDVPSSGGTKYTATITSTGNTSLAYAEYNGVKYYTQNDTFEFSTGDTITLYASGLASTATISVNGEVVASSSTSYVNYYYTSIASDVEITLSAGGSSTVSLISEYLAPNGTYSVSTNGVYDIRRYENVTVNIKNIHVTGTFKKSSSGYSNITIPYSGNGYPIAIDICVSDGALNKNGTFYNTLKRYAISWWSGNKENTSTPNYTDQTDSINFFSYSCRYKSSSTTAGTESGSTGTNAPVLYNANAAATRDAVVKMKSATVMSVYIGSNSYGFLAGIDYTYHIIYSE